MNVVIANGLEDYLEGTSPLLPRFLDEARTQVNSQLFQWERLNRLVMSWIYSSLTPAILGKIVEHQIAQDIWMKRMYIND